MPSDNETVGLALDGKVTLSQFVDAMAQFRRMVDAITAEVAPEAQIRWVVDFLEAGSAVAEIRGEAADTDAAVATDPTGAIAQVVAAWDQLGAAAEAGTPVPFSFALKAGLDQLTAMLNGEVHALTLSTRHTTHVITEAEDPGPMPALRVQSMMLDSMGAVTGRIETLQHRGLRFSLYELVDDKRVTCRLAPGQEDLVARAWGRLAIVEGRVRRDVRTGQPLQVTDITSVRLFDEARPGAWRDVAGIAPPPPAAPLPEDTIRQLRDDG